MDDTKREIGLDTIKQNVMIYVKKLLLAIQIVDKCNKKDAANKVVYFLKQLIFIIEDKNKT